MGSKCQGDKRRFFGAIIALLPRPCLSFRLEAKGALDYQEPLDALGIVRPAGVRWRAWARCAGVMTTTEMNQPCTERFGVQRDIARVDPEHLEQITRGPRKHRRSDPASRGHAP